MKAVVLAGYGGVENLQIADAPRPMAGPEQLLVKVYAAALNRADILQRKGKYPPPAGESAILGLEIAGEVVACGEMVTNFTAGDKVFGLVGGGGYAEYCLIDHVMAMPIPAGWTFEQAAAVPEAFFTADETLFELGQLKQDESVLIHAGGSGVGTAGIQMAKHQGATVYITAGTPEKIAKALQLGADAGINYKTQDFANELQHLTNAQGVNVIQDFLGASYLAKNLKSLQAGGRLVLVALMGGAKCEIDLSLVLTRRLQIKGSILRTRSLQDKRNMTQRFQERWLPLLAAGKIQPVIAATFAITDVQAAHQYMEANQNFGKIILRF